MLVADRGSACPEMTDDVGIEQADVGNEPGLELSLAACFTEQVLDVEDARLVVAFGLQQLRKVRFRHRLEP